MPRSWKCANEQCEAEQGPDMCHKCGGQRFTETFKRVSIQSHMLDEHLRDKSRKYIEEVTKFAMWFNDQKFEV